MVPKLTSGPAKNLSVHSLGTPERTEVKKTVLKLKKWD
jgi:hypothetical protein